MCESIDVEKRVRESLREYRRGTWRAPLFRDFVMNDFRRIGDGAAVLDVGCGGGFDDSVELQFDIGKEAGLFWGVEPDPEVIHQPVFDDIHNCGFEDAPLANDSVDLAYATFVLEHIENPAAFWNQLLRILRPGGIFWGFTMDRRHYFSWTSMILEAMRVKDTYLRLIQGPQQYENYPTFYRCNTPRAIRSQTTAFSRTDCWSWNRVGQLDHYVPRVLRPLSHTLDRLELACRLPGSLLIVRLVR